MVVPTLDVDLIWHTHQLSPRHYYAHSTTTITKDHPVHFEDDNDWVEEGRLSDSFEWTAKQYRKAAGGKDYCSCWYCEATRGRGLFEKLLISISKSKDTQMTRTQKPIPKALLTQMEAFHHTSQLTML